jgi:hypothetical protein
MNPEDWFDAIAGVVVLLIALVAFIKVSIQRGDRLFVLGQPKHKQLIDAAMWVVGLSGLAAFGYSGLFTPDVRSPAAGAAGLLLLLVAGLGNTKRLRGRLMEVLISDAQPDPPWCAFYQKGLVFFDGKAEQFIAWPEIERYEWTGERLTFYLTPATPGEAGAVYGWDVPFERREKVLDVIATRLQG